MHRRAHDWKENGDAIGGAHPPGSRRIAGAHQEKEEGDTTWPSQAAIPARSSTSVSAAARLPASGCALHSPVPGPALCWMDYGPVLDGLYGLYRLAAAGRYTAQCPALHWMDGLRPCTAREWGDNR